MNVKSWFVWFFVENNVYVLPGSKENLDTDDCHRFAVATNCKDAVQMLIKQSMLIKIVQSLTR